tara:strand:+ start:87 stop:881 length:795 start_codon:yes stop_codon:yes gene_type:complete
MKRIELEKIEHSVKIGKQCPYIEANITEDSIFYLDGEPVGFYMTQMTDKMCKLADIANKEFNSKNVPKTEMSRGPQGSKKDKAERAKANVELVTQMSAILGGVPPKPHMRRPYPTISSVHSVESAKTFIKAMLMLAKESEQLIKEIMPKQYEAQTELFKDVDNKWRFGNLFTSSISNYNISAPFHRDTGNIKGAVNVIICKRNNSKGGDLHVPDYDLTIGQQDNSILVYPAWKNIHGVTPIIPTHEGGYRNSLIFYPLKAFKGI